MALYIANNTLHPETLYASLIIYDPQHCAASGQPFRKVAWYTIRPGQTILPDVLNVDLRTVNRYAYIYAYTVSGKDFQGSGNAWTHVSNGVHFNQCFDDITNCPKVVDFIQIDFAGSPTIITYLGPNAGNIRSTTPSISIWPGNGSFYIIGNGFAAGTVVSIVYNYFPDLGGVTTNSGDPATAFVSPSGGFDQTIYVSTLLYPGRLDVQAADNSYPELVAATSEQF